MTTREIKEFMGKIRGTYPNQFFLEPEVIKVWTEKLEPYDKEDVERKFEEHLHGELRDRPPMIHYITNYLKTHEEKTKSDGDYQVACNLCGKWMPISKYDSHYGRCLTIDYLISKAKEKGAEITREELEQYPDSTIDKLYEKYKPEQTSMTDVFQRMV